MSHELDSAVQEADAALDIIRQSFCQATDPLYAKDCAMKYMEAHFMSLVKLKEERPTLDEPDLRAEVRRVIEESKKGNWEPMREELKSEAEMFFEDNDPGDIQLGIAFINLADSII